MIIQVFHHLHSVNFISYSYCMGIRTRQVQGTGPGAMATNMLYTNVHNGLRQGRDLESHVSYSAIPIPIPGRDSSVSSTLGFGARGCGFEPHCCC